MTGIGRCDTSAGAREQEPAGERLDGAQVVRDRRLGQPQLFGGARHATRAIHGEERSQRDQLLCGRHN